MNINILSISNSLSKWEEEGLTYYSKQFPKNINLNFINIKNKINPNHSIEKIIKEEANEILKRIRKFANNTLSEDKIQSIHFYKEKFFTELIPGTLYLRPTVIDVIRYAKNNSLKLGFISTTSESNINVIKSAIIDELDFSVFDLITSNKNVEKPKPDPEIYQYALDTLNLAEDEAIVIEDTVVNQNCALKAGVKCILFPGEYAEIPISNKYYTLTYNLMSKVEEVLG